MRHYYLLLGAAIAMLEQKEKEVTVKLGVIGADTDVWDDVKDRLKDEGINLEYVQFSDYNQPNAALADGSIDINSFQHQFFLDNYNKRVWNGSCFYRQYSQCAARDLFRQGERYQGIERRRDSSNSK